MIAYMALSGATVTFKTLHLNGKTYSWSEAAQDWVPDPLPLVRVGPSSLGYWTALALWALVALALALACGCSTALDYRTADRARFEAIAPEYDRYVDADSTLSPEQKERRFRLLRAWDADSAGLDERQNPAAPK